MTQSDEPMPPSHVADAAVAGGSGTSAEAGASAVASASAEAEKKRGGLLRETFLVLVTALVLSVLIKTFLVQAFFIPSSSMEDTLAVGDRIMVNKVASATDDIQRGDIVVFVDPGGWLPPAPEGGTSAVRETITQALTFVGLLPQDAGHHLVKRVIGVGGDEVACCSADGRLEVNGTPITEPYVKDGTQPSATEFRVSVPEGNVWVMGDNRANSEDSRAHMGRPGGGFVPLENVEGRAFVTLWPWENLGYLSRPEATFADVPG